MRAVIQRLAEEAPLQGEILVMLSVSMMPSMPQVAVRWSKMVCRHTPDSLHTRDYILRCLRFIAQAESQVAHDDVRALVEADAMIPQRDPTTRSRLPGLGEQWISGLDAVSEANSRVVRSGRVCIMVMAENTTPARVLSVPSAFCR